MLLKKNRSKRSNWGIHYQVKKDIESFEEEYLNGRKMSRDEVIEYLFGSYSDFPETDLKLYIINPPERKVLHRINHLWVYPLTFLLAPFRYVLYGDIGWHKDTKTGRFILKVCGYDKE